MVSQRYVYLLLLLGSLFSLSCLESAQAESIANTQGVTNIQALESGVELPSVESLTTPEFTPLTQNVTPPPSEIVIPKPEEPTDATPPASETPKPETPPVADPEVSRKILQTLMRNALRNSSTRYPWFVHPTSTIAESSTPFDPNNAQDYTTLDVQSRGDRMIIRDFEYGYFPKDEQFYWVLPGNRVVMETQGWKVGIRYHGETRETRIERRIQLTQALWGLQTVWTISQPLRELIGDVDPKTLTVQTISGEVVNPEGLVAGRVVFNTGVNDANAIRIPNTPLKLGSGSTFSNTGGSALFQFLEPENTPLILQGFPTSNLQPLLEGEGLFEGAKVPQSVLAQLGIAWGDPTTGVGTIAAPPITSLPGIKVSQLGKFDNLDLLNILVNSSLSQPQRDFHYLNSLYWVSLGQRAPRIIDAKVDSEDSYWHQFTLSRPRNRTLLQYDSTEAKATFSNVFANPGAALSFSFDQGKVNDLQTFNSSFGLLVGGVFELINLPGLNEGLQEAEERFKKLEPFANLDTKATSEQRRQINQRLNRSLFFANRTTGVQEASGTVTFPSTITPERSSVLQVRSGIHRRLVRFIQADRRWSAGETFLSRLRLSNEDFGPLTFVGAPIPTNETSLTPSNRSFATQIVLDAPDGRRFFQEFNSQDFATSDFTVVPSPIRSFDMAYDLIELSQIGEEVTRINRFDGYLFLPTVEALWSGSNGKWNYVVNTGMWLNFNANSVFEVSTNNRGIADPTVGLYFNAFVNHIDTKVRTGKDGKPRSLITLVPSARLAWNTAANPSNPSYLNLSYLYSEQFDRFSFSATPGLFIVNDNARVEPVPFFQGQFALRSGFEFNTSLEWGDNFFYSLEAAQKVNAVWTVGSYVRNYRSDSSWVGRVTDLSYGLLVRHKPLNRAMSWESSLGIGGNSLEVRLQGNFQF